MLTYEYECQACDLTFEWRQGITETPLEECPECQGPVHRLASGGAGFMLKGRTLAGSGASENLVPWNREAAPAAVVKNVATGRRAEVIE